MKDVDPIIIEGPTWITPIEFPAGRLTLGTPLKLDPIQDVVAMRNEIMMKIGSFPDHVLIDARFERMERREMRKAWKAWQKQMKLKYLRTITKGGTR